MQDAPSTLTAAEADAILAARTMVKAVARRLGTVACGPDAAAALYGLGRVVAELDHADEALFATLNCASSYAGCPVAEAAIKRWSSR